MYKIGIITGTRAEYGLLKPVINKVYMAEELELQLIVTGMHLSPEFGMTYKEIEEDGYPITMKIEMLLSSDTSVGITKSVGLAMISFADYYEIYKPDIVVILGDRFEMLAAASAAMIARVPIAHIHGGELTEGAIDEAIRHSITKMGYLHFCATTIYRKRIIQLGEEPQRVYGVGALGVENIKKLPLLSKKELEKSIGFKLNKKVIMVTYHPVTLDKIPPKTAFKNLLNVISLYKDFCVIFTKANADTDGRDINKIIDSYVEKNKERCISFISMGQLKYLSALKYCYAVVGNSSSGIIEAPSFHIPTIDIGDRQRGRVRAKSIIHCNSDVNSIKEAFNKILSEEYLKKIKCCSNPYEGNETSKSIVRIIHETLENGIKLKKKFYDLEVKE